MTRASVLLSELSRAAKAFGELLDEVVFVGGATVPCYIDDPAAPDIRPTDDVDVVVATLTRGAYHRFEDKLRAAGFSNDQSEGAPIDVQYVRLLGHSHGGDRRSSGTGRIRTFS